MNFWLGAPKRARLIGLALLITTFLVGALAGAAVIRVLGAGEPPPPRWAAPHRAGPEDMFERLSLTRAQREQVEAILERRRTQMDAFWKQHGGTLRAIVDSTRAEIRSLLTPAQLAEEERIWAERKAFHKDRGMRAGAPKQEPK